MLPVFILDRTPDATDTVAWASICHRKDKYVLIRHDQNYERSRWDYAPRKRPFAVSLNGPRFTYSHHTTLENAIKAARKLAKTKI
jgi:hypothetical protein